MDSLKLDSLHCILDIAKSKTRLYNDDCESLSQGAVMNIDKYRMLLEAADTGSLSKAAEKFGYTPSGMVHIVNSLEQEFSFPIL